jgi:hypothetical protein
MDEANRERTWELLGLLFKAIPGTAWPPGPTPPTW